MSYIDDHRASGFQVGDRVRVFASCQSMSGGWENSWCPDMKIGNEGRIVYDGHERGFKLSDGYGYPWFVLEKIND